MHFPVDDDCGAAYHHAGVFGWSGLGPAHYHGLHFHARVVFRHERLSREQIRCATPVLYRHGRFYRGMLRFAFRDELSGAARISPGAGDRRGHFASAYSSGGTFGISQKPIRQGYGHCGAHYRVRARNRPGDLGLHRRCVGVASGVRRAWRGLCRGDAACDSVFAECDAQARNASALRYALRDAVLVRSDMPACRDGVHRTIGAGRGGRGKHRVGRCAPVRVRSSTTEDSESASQAFVLCESSIRGWACARTAWQPVVYGGFHHGSAVRARCARRFSGRFGPGYSTRSGVVGLFEPHNGSSARFARAVAAAYCGLRFAAGRNAGVCRV